MRAKRVILLSNRSLLAAGVQRLLQGVDGLELAIVTAKNSEAIAKLRQLDPEVIVLDTGDPSLGEGVVTILLGQHPRARVIALNLDRTGIEVYSLHRVVHADIEGLLEAIHGRRRLPGKESSQKTATTANGGDGGATISR